MSCIQCHSYGGGGKGLLPALDFSFSTHISYPADFCTGTISASVFRFKMQKSLELDLVAKAGISKILFYY